jgi:hypothetical protein
MATTEISLHIERNERLRKEKNKQSKNYVAQGHCVVHIEGSSDSNLAYKDQSWPHRVHPHPLPEHWYQGVG